MRNHGSQHWRKPHGIRYRDYRNNSLIRAALLKISLHALSPRLVQRTHVDLSTYREEKPIGNMFLHQEITRNLYQISLTLLYDRTQDMILPSQRDTRKRLKFPRGGYAVSHAFARVSRLWRLDRIDRGLPLTDAFVRRNDRDWILSRSWRRAA